MSILFADDLCSSYVAEVVKSFQALKPNAYLGRTALQKLVYFSKAIGVPVPCSYEIYNYGPYSEEVSRSVTALIADDIIQDISGRTKYSSYKPGNSVDQIPQPFRLETEKYRPMIDAIVSAIGDRSPSTLELIATLHFVNAKQHGIIGSKPLYDSVLREFKSIKGEKFSIDVIWQWYQWLDTSGLLS